MTTDDVSSPAFWDEIYQHGRAGWDLGRPTPIFQRLLARHEFSPGRMIVLGAGRGHDAREFARYDFEVTAVDFAYEPVRDMRLLARRGVDFNILQADVFALPADFTARFEYVLEYTCYCAIDPRRRPAYADQVARLLRPGGVYIHLAFPLDAHAGGPPFAVSAAEILALFEARGFDLLEREVPSDSVPQRRGLEELFIFRQRGEAGRAFGESPGDAHDR